MMGRCASLDGDCIGRYSSLIGHDVLSGNAWNVGQSTVDESGTVGLASSWDYGPLVADDSTDRVSHCLLMLHLIELTDSTKIR